MKWILSIVLVTSSIYLLAQNKQDLLSDPNVVWAGILEIDYVPDISSYEQNLEKQYGVKHRNIFKTLKLQTNDPEQDIPLELHHIILNKNLNNIQFYKDPDLTSPMASATVINQFAGLDTVIIFNATTYEEEIKLVRYEIHLDDAPVFRLRSYIFYNKKEMAFHCIPSAIAPIYVNKRGSRLYKIPMGWMDINDLTKSPKLKNKKITWAKRLYRNIDLEDVEVFKSVLNLDQTLQLMLEDIEKNAATQKLAEPINADGTSNYLNTEEIKHLFHSIDTVVVFDPDTFEEEYIIVANDVDVKELRYLRLYQDWYWDDKQQQLSIKYLGFAPIKNVYDAVGDLKYRIPLFIKRLDRQ